MPRPAAVNRLTGALLRARGLSEAKGAAVMDLAARTLSGEVPTLGEARALGGAEIVERLSAVAGIGRWTAEMFLLFRQGRPDVLPLGDHSLRRGFAYAFGGLWHLSQSGIACRAEAWRPYRTAASRYLWRAAEVGVIPEVPPTAARSTAGGSRPRCRGPAGVHGILAGGRRGEWLPCPAAACGVC